MEKWFEKEGVNGEVAVASRVRLTRNLDSCPFPVRADESELRAAAEHIGDQIPGLFGYLGLEYRTASLSKMSDEDRRALRERQLISKHACDEETKARLVASRDESVGILINSDDHLRIQVSKSGMNLQNAYDEANRIDDYLDDRLNFAFDDTYGYMTTFPTHMGTGMQCYLVLHLPMLTGNKRFQLITNEMSRFGLVIKGAFGEEDNYGDFYVLHNQRTLGQTEDELLEVLNRVGTQVIEQEKKLRGIAAGSGRIKLEDEVYRAYGLLRYARKLTWKEAAEAISKLRVGVGEELIRLEEETSLYKLLLDSRPACVQKAAGRAMNEEEIDRLRADLIRKSLPELR